MLTLHRHIHMALVVYGMHAVEPPRPHARHHDMVAESGKLGPRNIVWLRNRLNPKHVGTNVKTVGGDVVILKR